MVNNYITNHVKLNKLIKILLTFIRANAKINLLIMLVKKITKKEREKDYEKRSQENDRMYRYVRHAGGFHAAGLRRKER